MSYLSPIPSKHNGTFKKWRERQSDSLFPLDIKGLFKMLWQFEMLWIPIIITFHTQQLWQNRKRDDAWFEKRKWNKTPNSDNNSRSRSRSETRNSNNRRYKRKSTERIVLQPRNNQNRSTRSKTENNREKYEQKKNIFKRTWNHRHHN